MCGIFGFWLNRQITENEKKRALNSLKSFSYRGPDFSDHYINNKRTLFLGHNRLSILDLHNRSNQPMKFDENVRDWFNLSEQSWNDMSEAGRNSLRDTYSNNNRN